jgi:guanine nucleotide-binding protein G(i) subunit alpha
VCYFANSLSFFDNIYRIAEPGYLPTRNDILHLPQQYEDSREVILAVDELVIRILAPRDDNDSTIQKIRDIDAVVYVVNIASYDEISREMNQLVDTLRHFKEIICPQVFGEQSMILLLNKAKEFKEKLPKSPLSNTFPNYTGGASADLAAKYILNQFIGVNHSEHVLRTYLVDLDNTSIRALILSAVETVLRPWAEAPILRIWK